MTTEPEHRIVRTPAEQRLLAFMAQVRGRAFVERHADLILEQARMLGELS